MTSMRVCVVLSVLALSSVLAAQSSLSPEALLKAAINREVVEGDFPAAMEQYQTIAAKYATNRPVASKALLHLGTLQERLGRPEARATYQRIVADYADSGAAATTARARLSAIQQAAGGPFRDRSLDVGLRGALRISGSPDGKFVSYARPQPGKTVVVDGVAQPVVALYLREIANGRERVLLELAPPNEIFWTGLEWSPDSRSVATAVHTLESTIEYRIITLSNSRTQALGRGTVRGFAESGPFTWSPDSRHLLFGRKLTPEGPLEIQVATVGSEAVQTIGQTTPAWTGAVWSADSTRFAYLAPGGNGHVIRLVSVNGAELRTLPIPVIGPNRRTTVTKWAPDDRIMFTQFAAGANDQYAIPATGGTARKICEGRGSSGGDGCQGYSPDGLWQIVRKNESEGGRIVLRHTVDGAERPLTTQAAFEQTAVGFSPDGRLFAFRSNRDGQWAVYVVPTDRLPVANPVKVVSLESANTGIDGWWTTSGLVLSVHEFEINLFRVDMDVRTGHPTTNQPVRLTEDSPLNSTAFVSPDGQRIAYKSTDGAHRGFAVMDANGARERIVREFPGNALIRMALMGWKSANELLFLDAGVGTGPQPPQTLKILNVTTGEVSALAGPLQSASGSFAPGTSELLYVSRSDLELYSRPIAGGADRKIPTPDDALGYFVVSPNGQSLAYSVWDTDALGGKSPIAGEIRVRPIGGKDKTVVTYANSAKGFHGPVAFSPDGKHLLYRDPALELRIVNVETTESWPLVTSKAPDVDIDSFSAHWSPDGTFIVIQSRTERTSWHAFEGVTYDAVTKITAGRK